MTRPHAPYTPKLSFVLSPALFYMYAVIVINTRLHAYVLPIHSLLQIRYHPLPVNPSLALYAVWWNAHFMRIKSVHKRRITFFWPKIGTLRVRRISENRKRTLSGLWLHFFSPFSRARKRSKAKNTVRSAFL